ncbi:FecR family protein [Puteibacter caeruleilacunae]|nr:FecR family protein [Puteibacter caeruleilacunae]
MGKRHTDIIKKYMLGTSTREEFEKATSLLEEPLKNHELKPILHDLWNEDTTDQVEVPDHGGFSGILNELHKKIKRDLINQKRQNSRRLLINISRVAAILIIGIVMGVIIQKFQNNAPVYYTSMAPKGSVSQMLLPDSTMVFLNSDSEIRYSMTGVDGNREVFLKGEAWFQVTKNEKKPFVVHTDFYDVNVLGTEFNVKAYPEENHATTTLEKGSVKISSQRFKIKSNSTLKPGEQMVYDKEKRAFIKKQVDTEVYTSWRENKLIFIDIRLEELIRMVERKYGVDIIVEDKSILDFHYDGTIKDETITELMSILQATLPIHVEIENQKIIITKMK